jgi:aerobic-type carbon monoxide dehydrogenase small subunit (CoxS/CutS family)
MNAGFYRPPGIAGEPIGKLPMSEINMQENTSVAGAVAVCLHINGKNYDVQLEPRVSLLDALREYIGLTGTKKGCNQGACDACTVLVDGERINACLALAMQYQGRDITTIEGIADGNTMHPLQAAFIEHDGFQCGYCTPGQICSALGMFEEFKHGAPSLPKTFCSVQARAKQPSKPLRQRSSKRRAATHIMRSR